MNDPYTILGVSPNSSDQEIKSAYRKLAKQHHPDTGGDQQRFAEISSAYDSIKNAESRQNFENSHYDPSNFQQSQNPFADAFGHNFDDMFQQMFSQRASRNQNTHVTYHVDLQDVHDCATKNLNISMPNGMSKPVKITIPKGIASGQQVRYTGMAPNGSDLIVEFIFKPHNEFAVQEHNLIKKLNITLKEALFGTDKVINTLDNRGIKLHIKAGTQSGTKLRVPESGLPRRNLPNGDLFIEIKVKLPNLKPQDMDKTLREILR